MDPKTTVDVFRKAKDALQARGWCQRAFLDGTGAVCALGAVNVACSGRADIASDASSEAVAILSKIAGAANLVVWNDDPCRTPDDVMALFDEGIDLMERP